MNFSSMERWSAQGYFQDYYSERVEPDEQKALQFQVAFLQKHRKRFAKALEYGAGPTLMRAIAVAPYVDSLDMADYAIENLQHIRYWIEKHPEANNWHHFTQYILTCEENAVPSLQDVLDREHQTRQIIAALLPSDARDPFPLGEERLESYDLLISGFCLEAVSPDRSLWESCINKVFRLLKPGGTFIIASVRDCTAYRVGELWFPTAKVSAPDLEATLLTAGASKADLQIVDHDLPSHEDQGYSGILLASGKKLD